MLELTATEVKQVDKTTNLYEGVGKMQVELYSSSLSIMFTDSGILGSFAAPKKTLRRSWPQAFQS